MSKLTIPEAQVIIASMEADLATTSPDDELRAETEEGIHSLKRTLAWCEAHGKELILRHDFPGIRPKLNQDYLKGFLDKIQYHRTINGSYYEHVYEDVYKSTKDIFRQIAKVLDLPLTGIKSEINMSCRVHQHLENSYLTIQNDQFIKEMNGVFIHRHTDRYEYFEFYINVPDWTIHTSREALSHRVEKYDGIVAQLSRYDKK
ncbi:hypothetical protein [Paraburkholderia aromaticivorans]|uniref:hypothetical protein n=1 Tax=Paraburkholderia aromaticivorans TaxID=2026199 RepID=UPI0038B7510D